MATYINTQTLQYPVTESEIRAAHPNTSFAVPFSAPAPYAVVFDAPQPAFDAITQYVRQAAPVLTNKGHWQQQWEVVDLDAETAAANAEAARVRAIPASVSPRQIRQALTRSNLRTAVEAAVAAGDQDLKDWWEFATAFERQNQHVIDMAAALNVTERQLDDLWTLAGTL